MPTISRTPIYNLKAALKETGLTADALRAWERRYDLPRPQRTPGGHRLYSEYDIETVKWLRARQAEGLSISRAVKLWKEILAAGRDPLDGNLPAGSPPAAVFQPSADTGIEALRRSWLETCLAFDETGAEAVLNQAFAIFPVETVCAGVLQQGLRIIGEWWYEGKASVQQEHFASALAVRRVQALINAAPRHTRQCTVLMGCPPGEWHTFPVLLLTLLLRRRGLNVVYLGADVPLEQLQETIAAVQPDLVVLAAQQLTTAATIRSVALALQGKGFSLAYGGLIFNRVPELRDRIPAHFLGESLEAAVGQIERLASAPVPVPTIVRAGDSGRVLANLYRDRRWLIEFELYENLHAAGQPANYIREANAFFGDGLSAALDLGDPAFLEADLEWVKCLLAGHHIPEARLIPYLAAYCHAMRSVMGDAGDQISDWIDSYLAQNDAPL